LGQAALVAQSNARSLPMKAEQLDGRSCSPTDKRARRQRIAEAIDAGGLTIVDGQRTLVSVLTDRDHARAAYTQAVALYDSCVKYAVARQRAVGAQRPSKVIAAERGL
jgi:hypothetical protein